MILDPCNLLVMKHLTDLCFFFGIKTKSSANFKQILFFPGERFQFVENFSTKVVNLQSCWLMKIAPCHISAGFLFATRRFEVRCQEKR